MVHAISVGSLFCSRFEILYFYGPIYRCENWLVIIRIISTISLAEYNRPDRDAVLQILDDDRYHNDAKTWKIKCLNEGRSWRYMIDNYMPSLRAASWVCVWGEVMEPLEKLSCITTARATRTCLQTILVLVRLIFLVKNIR